MWQHIQSELFLNQIIFEESKNNPVLLFKHSNRCSVSFFAKKMFEQNWNSEIPVKLYLIDVVVERPISNKIEELLKVVHESPQVLLLKDGKCIYHSSHNSIDAKTIEDKL